MKPKSSKQWFDIDKDGLAKLIEGHSKGRLIAELLQNALDEPVTTVTITITPQPGRPLVEIAVEDDAPEGFKDLAHSFTLFAESYKKIDPTKRGRFNIGEKLVLALCRSASITTTTGTVVFNENGQRNTKPKTKRDRGSEFRAIIRMNRTEHDEAIQYLKTVLIPAGVTVTLNGEILVPRPPLHTFEASLETEIADEAGVLRPRQRHTLIEIHEVKDGEKASIYEMGLPVVETGDRWHINIGQKVPLNLNRDNVKPAYLRRLRTLVINAMHEHLTAEDANSTWVQQATSHPDCNPEAISTFMERKFGENRASFDPTDPEAGKRIQAGGGTLITGSMLNRQQWANAKEAGAIQPAGKLCPTPKPYSDDPNAQPENVVPPSEWTPAIRNIAEYARFLSQELMGFRVNIKITRTPNRFVACYGGRELTFNLQRLGHKWFEQGPSVDVDVLLIHEFGHEYSGDHLSDEYYKSLCELGAKLKQLAMVKSHELMKYQNE